MKELTWEELADLHDERTGGRARTRPMDAVFEWALTQPDIEETETGGLHLIKAKEKQHEV